MPVTGTFKATHALSARQEISANFLRHTPGCVPVVIERAPSSSLSDLPRTRLSVPVEQNIARFMFDVRRKLRAEAHEAIFLYFHDPTNGGGNGGTVLEPSSETFGRLYQWYKDEDGMLYITYAAENTFGGGVGGGDM